MLFSRVGKQCSSLSAWYFNHWFFFLRKSQVRCYWVRKINFLFWKCIRRRLYDFMIVAHSMLTCICLFWLWQYSVISYLSWQHSEKRGNNSTKTIMMLTTTIWHGCSNRDSVLVSLLWYCIQMKKHFSKKIFTQQMKLLFVCVCHRNEWMCNQCKWALVVVMSLWF